MKHKIYFILIALIFSGCELIPDLERDNPNDEQSENYNGGSNNNNNDKPNIEFSRIVSHFTNYNGVVAGETVYFQVYVKNISEIQANKVRAIISTNSDKISGFSPTDEIKFQTDALNDFVFPENEALGVHTNNYSNWEQNYTIEFTINDDVSSGTVISFQIDIDDEDNNQWEDSFTITVN
jgi:hypothetical protein